MFAVRLKQLREAAGYSQAVLARKLGVCQSTVGMWENGKNRPQNAKLEMLAEIFDVDTDYLLGRTDNPAKEKLSEIGAALYPPTMSQKLRRLTAGLMSMPGSELDRIDKMLTAAYPEFFAESRDDDEA